MTLCQMAAAAAAVTTDLDDVEQLVDDVEDDIPACHALLSSVLGDESLDGEDHFVGDDPRRGIHQRLHSTDHRTT